MNHDRIQDPMVKMASPPATPIMPTPDKGVYRRPILLDLAIGILRISDVMALVVSSVVLTYILVQQYPGTPWDSYINATVIASVFYAGLADVIGAYDPDTRFSVRRSSSRVLTAWLATVMFMLTLGFLLKASDDFSRGWATAWFFAASFSLCLVRSIAAVWMTSLKKQGIFNQRVAIFGAGSQGDRLARYICGNDKLTIELVGFFDDRTEDRLPPREMPLPMHGNLGNLTQMIRAGEVDQVIIALPWAAEVRLQAVVAALAIMPVRIRLAPDLAGFAFAQSPMVMLGDLPMMTLFERPISGFDQIMKKFEDMLIGLLALILVSPILLLAAIAIKLDSKGPIFFRQEREGFNNKTFRIWKFRSMYTDLSQFEKVVQATRDDPRITRVGRILRRLSIDELPQIFNVLAGEMSLVGPRPHAPSTRAGDRTFSEVVATYAARHKVKPGITGWAQVNGWRGETDTEDKLLKRLECDLYYIENWSLMLDLYIMARTGIFLFFSRQAY